MMNGMENSTDLDLDNFPPLSPSSSIDTDAEKIEILQSTILEINSKLGIIKAQNDCLVSQNTKLTRDYTELKNYVAQLEAKLSVTADANEIHSSDSDSMAMDEDTQVSRDMKRTSRKRSTPAPVSQSKLKKTSEIFKIPINNKFHVLQKPIPTPNVPPTSQPIPSSSKQISAAPSRPGTSSEDKTNATPTTPSVKIPPIIVHNKDKWTIISTHLKNNHIDFVSAKNTDDGIKINMTDIDSYRKATKFLELQKIEFHTFQLQDEKLLHVVIRGIPTEIDIEDVKRELLARDYHPTTIRRMVQRKPIERPLPLVVLLLPREEKSIYNLTDLLDLKIRVETLRSKPSVTQCFNCQRYGHAQSKCRALPKCLKCGGGHPTYTCTKSRATPAKCANCGGAHPANFSGCSSRPKIQEKPQVTAARIPQSTYASATRANTEPLIPHPSLSAPTSLNPQVVINSLIQSFVTQLNTFAQRFASSFEPGQLKL